MKGKGDVLDSALPLTLCSWGLHPLGQTGRSSHGWMPIVWVLWGCQLGCDGWREWGDWGEENESPKSVF